MTVVQKQETPEQVAIAREAWAAALDVIRARQGDQYVALTCAVMLVVDYARTYQVGLQPILQAFVTNAINNYGEGVPAQRSVDPS